MQCVHKYWYDPMSAFARCLEYYVHVCLPFRQQRRPLALFHLRLQFFYVCRPDTRCYVVPPIYLCTFFFFGKYAGRVKLCHEPGYLALHEPLERRQQRLFE